MDLVRFFARRHLAVLFLIPALVLIALLGSAPRVAVAQQKAEAPQKKESAALAPVVSGQECLTCHEDLTKSFALSPHGKAAGSLKGTEAPTCDSCHGSSTKHVDSADAKDISNPAKIPSAQVSDTCLACHARDESHAFWRTSPHDRTDMSCVSCHREHHPASEKFRTRTGLMPTSLMQNEVSDKLLKQPDQELCLSCHKDVRKATLQRSTHLFATAHGETKVSCISCHNPHGGEGKTMLLASSNTQLCYECHAEKRGPFLWEHKPGRENCNTCHLPHGSNNQFLLKARPTVLCQSCHMHTLWRHETVAGFDIYTFNHGCTNCHTQIHGSNHPSGKAFTR